MGYIRLMVRAPLVVACLLTTLIVMSLFSLLRLQQFNKPTMQLALRIGAILFGLRISLYGTPSRQRPLLLVSNHFSYLDIFAIGSHLPASFTPKSEIASWPVIGPLCKMAGCLFIDRKPSKTLENKKLLHDAGNRGDIISLFPEGTTNEGKSILPFRSSFFSLAENGAIAVQPLSVVYTSLNGKPLDEQGLPIVGWYGDAYFFPHVVQFLKQRGAEVTLVFHRTVTGDGFVSRKALAQHCWHEVEKSFHELLPQLFGFEAHKKRPPDESGGNNQTMEGNRVTLP